MISYPHTFDMESFDWGMHANLSWLRTFIKEGYLKNDSIITPMDARFTLNSPYKKDKQFKIRHIGLEAQFNAIDGEIRVEQELYISDRVVLYAVGSSITIGENVMFSPNTAVYASHHDSGDHDVYKADKVIIGNNVWIADGAKIMPGSRIPDGCTVGANAVVTKRFRKKNKLIAGVPAKVIK